MKKILTFLIFCLILFPNQLLSDDQSFTGDSITAQQLFYSGIDLIRSGENNRGIDSLKASLEIRKNIYAQKNYQTGTVENALGIAYNRIGQYDNALEFFLEAEESYLADSKTSSNAMADLFNNMGNVYRAKLDFTTAINYFNQAINIHLQQEKIDHLGIADFYYSIAEIYKNTGEYENAISLIDEYSPNAYADTKLLYWDLKGIVYQLLNEADKANNAYLQAIELAQELVNEGYVYDIELANEYLNYASFLISFERTDDVLEILSNAYEIITKTQEEEGADLAQYYTVLGDYHRAKKVESTEINAFKQQKAYNLTEAVESYRDGLKALNFDIDPTVDSLPDIGRSLSLIQSLNLLKIVADTYVEMADVYDESGTDEYRQSLYNAIDYYDFTAEIIQNARKEISSDASKIQLAGLEEQTFHNMIETAYKAYELTVDYEVLDFAFKNAERIKASAIFDQLSGELAKNQLIPDSLRELENNLNYEITRNNELIYNLEREEERDEEQLAEAEAELFELKKRRDELNHYLEDTYPEYYELKYSDQLLSIADIQNRLKNNEVLIEYVLSESNTLPKLYAFLVTKNDVRFLRPEIDSTFLNAAVNTFHFMSDSRFMFTKNADAKEFCVDASHLYQKLISPFEESIRDKKLIIIPDGKLNYIAFDALIEELPDTTSTINFAQLDYLIKKNNINYSYSANLLYGLEKTNKTANERLVAFAPEYSDDTISFNNRQLALMPLPGIREEVELIADEISSKLFLGADASEQNFRESSENFDILHLAMHAFIDDSDPAFSSLAFSQNDSDEPENNGQLNTADIYNLDLNARLTVLSACNTGSGELQKGEGVMSLARGFFYAGCPSIVMTLWEVDDNAGTKIMASFYRHLKKGRAVDESLRMAKLEYLENANPRTAHPHYWLGYVSIGSSSPLFRSYDYYFFGLLFIALIAVTIDQVVRVRKSRKN